MKRPRAPAVGEADTLMFRSSVGSVRPLRRGNPQPVERPQPAPKRHAGKQGDALPLSCLLAAEGDHNNPDGPQQYLRDGYPPSLLRALKSGRVAAQDEFDLHHMSAAAARRHLLDFVEEACHAGMTCVRVIHGKGYGSREGGPVLKGLACRLLQAHDQVLAYTSAAARQGGTGALLVLLKRS